MNLIQKVRIKAEINRVSRRRALNHWFGQVRLISLSVWELPEPRPNSIYFDEDLQALREMPQLAAEKVD